MKILTANPAKNITVFVLTPVESPAERAALNLAILAESRLGAEQVGFVIPPERVSSPGAPGGTSSSGAPGGAAREHGSVCKHGGLWRLEMAGGEFCGNAARSFGLYVAAKQGLKGKGEFFVSVSGAGAPVRVEVDTEKSRAAAEMPKPVATESLDYKGRLLPVLIFEGITHVIAAGLEAGPETFNGIKSLADKMFSGALGVMFCGASCSETGGGETRPVQEAAHGRATARFVSMRPAVFVRSSGSLIFESSCGSGSAALGAWLSRELRDGTARYAITQPGGVIETEVEKRAGEITRIRIAGDVTLGEPEEFPREVLPLPAGDGAP